MQKTTRLPLADGVHLTCLQTEQYKQSLLSVGFVLPLTNDNTLAALTPQVLHRGTAALPDLDLLGQTLDTLYGARIYPVVRKMGDAMMIGTIADLMDEAYAPSGEQLTAKVAGLLHEIWHAPYLTDGLLCPDYTKAEGVNLAAKIEAQKNDPRTYVLRRLREILCENEPACQNEYGLPAAARAAGNEALTAFWKRTVAQAPVELFYCGSLSPEALCKALSPLYDVQAPAPRDSLPVSLPHAFSGSAQTVTEERQAAQGKLAIGFSTGITASAPQYPALMVLNTLFGGYTGSRLFVHVREKRSLCYYASSALDKWKGLLLVSSGILNENFDTARDEILRQMEDLQNKPVSPEELDGAKRTLSDQLRAMSDNPLSLEYFFLGQAVGQFSDNLDTLLKKIDQVQAEDVLQAAQKIALDRIYFMKGVSV